MRFLYRRGASPLAFLWPSAHPLWRVVAASSIGTHDVALMSDFWGNARARASASPALRRPLLTLSLHAPTIATVEEIAHFLAQFPHSIRFHETNFFLSHRLP